MSEEGGPGWIQKSVGAKRGRASGIDGPGGRIYPVHTKKRNEGYVPFVLHRWPNLVPGSVPDEQNVFEPEDSFYRGQL